MFRIHHSKNSTDTLSNSEIWSQLVQWYYQCISDISQKVGHHATPCGQSPIGLIYLEAKDPTPFLSRTTILSYSTVTDTFHIKKDSIISFWAWLPSFDHAKSYYGQWACLLVSLQPVLLDIFRNLRARTPNLLKFFIPSRNILVGFD